MDKNKKLCELLGIHWHEWKEQEGFGIPDADEFLAEECECGRLKIYREDENPDFLLFIFVRVKVKKIFTAYASLHSDTPS